MSMPTLKEEAEARFLNAVYVAFDQNSFIGQIADAAIIYAHEMQIGGRGIVEFIEAEAAGLEVVADMARATFDVP